jgi:glucose-6-phosphate 1-epimerase
MPSHRFVRRDRRGELDVLVVDHPRAQASFALQGAQLLSYTPAGEREVVWLSDKAEYVRGLPVRGGVPVCAPWFGALERNPPEVRARVAAERAPAHGLVRDVLWDLDSVTEDFDADGGVRVTFGLGAGARAFTGWRGPVDLRLEYAVGRELQARLTVTAMEEPVELTLALHTYLAVSDVADIQIEGLEGVRYLDTLDGWRERRETAPVHLTGEVDRVYLGVTKPTVVADTGWNRRVEVHHEGSRSLVLWNPHVQKSARLAQMAPDAWRRMLCIETANVLEDALPLEPGDVHTVGFTLRTRPLA